MVETVTKPTNQETIRDKQGKFLPGQSGNPTGKNAGRPDYEKQLNEIIKEVEKEQRKPFLKAFVETAYKNPQVMIALAKKILPDKIDAKTGITFNITYKQVERMKDIVSKAQERGVFANESN